LGEKVGQLSEVNSPMGWRDRSYVGEGYGGDAWSGSTGIGLSRPTYVVTILLIANFAVFLLTVIPNSLGAFLAQYGLMTVWGHHGGVLTGQVWRLVTYQYLHDSSTPFHLLYNMLGLYFFGPVLESRWGSRRFFGFYTACGVAGGLFFTLMVILGVFGDARMVGASGCVLGLLAACAVMFPQMVIILLFFPVPIRMAALLLVVVYVLSILTSITQGGGNAGGDSAHLGGMAFGAAWCLWGGVDWLDRIRQRRTQGAWQRKLRKEQDLQREVDRILVKVHDHGIQSLSSREKKTLADATTAEREKERRIRRM